MDSNIKNDKDWDTLHKFALHCKDGNYSPRKIVSAINCLKMTQKNRIIEFLANLIGDKVELDVIDEMGCFYNSLINETEKHDAIHGTVNKNDSFLYGINNSCLDRNNMEDRNNMDRCEKYFFQTIEFMDRIVENDRRNMQWISHIHDIFLPIYDLIFYRNRMMPIVECLYLKEVARKIEGNRKGVNKCVQKMFEQLIILKKDLFLSKDYWSDKVMGFFKFLGKIDEKKYFMNNAINTIVEQSMKELEPYLFDFERVYDYLRDTIYLLSPKIFFRIKQRIFKQLYGNLDKHKLAAELGRYDKQLYVDLHHRNLNKRSYDEQLYVSLNKQYHYNSADESTYKKNISLVYIIHCIGGVLDKLREAYELFLETEVGDRFCERLYRKYLLIKMILSAFEEGYSSEFNTFMSGEREAFIKIEKNYFERVLDSSDAAKIVSKYIDETIKLFWPEEGHEIWKSCICEDDMTTSSDLAHNKNSTSNLKKRKIGMLEYETRINILKFLVHVIVKSRRIDYLMGIIKNDTAERILMNHFYGKKRSDVEKWFIEMLPPVYCNKMMRMLENSEKLIVDDRNNVLLVDMAKWPDYSFSHLDVSSELDKIKQVYEQQLLKNKKKVKWLDCLFKAKISIYGRTIIVTAFQFQILNTIIEKCYLQDGKWRVQKINLVIDSEYKDQFEMLIKRRLIEEDGDFYVLNSVFEFEKSFLPDVYPLRAGGDKLVEELQEENNSASLEAKMAKIMKKQKKIKRENLCNLFNDKNNFARILEVLVKKGIVEENDETIVYIP